MAANANRDEATNGCAFERSVADALVGEVDVINRSADVVQLVSGSQDSWISDESSLSVCLS